MEPLEGSVQHRLAPHATTIPPDYAVDSEKVDNGKTVDVEMNSISEGKAVEERDFHRKQVSPLMIIDDRQNSAKRLLHLRSSQGGNWHGM